MENLDYSHDKKDDSVGIVSYGEETDSFDETINSLDGNLWCKFNTVPIIKSGSDTSFSFTVAKLEIDAIL